MKTEIKKGPIEHNLNEQVIFMRQLVKRMTEELPRAEEFGEGTAQRAAKKVALARASLATIENARDFSHRVMHPESYV